MCNSLCNLIYDDHEAMLQQQKSLEDKYSFNVIPLCMNALNRNRYRSEEHIGQVKAQTGVAKKQLNQETLVRSIYLKKGKEKKWPLPKVSGN